MPVRFQRPELPSDAEIERYLAASREARWFSNRGPCHEQLSRRLARFLGDDVHIVLTANATLGLMITLRSVLTASRSGAFVITPSFTFPATAQAICWSGLRPLWADVDADGWHLDPDALEGLLHTRGADVVAVLACSTFGTAPPRAQTNGWERACAAAGVPLVVDSAAGFGSCDELGTLLGTQGAAEVFSFHATKPFAVGEGGAVATRDRDLAERLLAMGNFDFRNDRVVGSPLGLNAKMSEMHAAIGLAVLDRFEGVLAARRIRAERLRERLEPAGYTFQAGARGSAWQFVPVLAPTASVREAVLSAAPDLQVEIRSYHAPLHELPAFAEDQPPAPLPVTDDIASRSLSLPLANDLTEEELDRICGLLLGCVSPVVETRKAQP